MRWKRKIFTSIDSLPSPQSVLVNLSQDTEEEMSQETSVACVSKTGGKGNRDLGWKTKASRM